MYISWSIKVTPWGVTWRDLWESYRRQIFVSLSPHSRILVAGHAERSTRICEEVWLMPKICTNIHQPGGVLNPLSSPWPFAQWSLDIVRHFPKVVGNKRYLLVGTDYFTKWVEAEPLANIRDMDPRDLFGKILSLGLGSLIPLSRIMVFSLIARPLGGTVVTWELRIDIPPRFIPEGMDRPRLSIRS